MCALACFVYSRRENACVVGWPLRFGSALQELGQNPEAHLIASHGTFPHWSHAPLCGRLSNANLHACLALHRLCSKPTPTCRRARRGLGCARATTHAHAVITNHKKGRCEFAQPHLSPRTARSRGQSHPISGETPDPPQRRRDLGVEISLPWCGRMGAEGEAN
jgi:hypothetical protein